MQDSDFSLSSLLCDESESCFDDFECKEPNQDFVFDENDDDDEFIEILLERENNSFGSKSDADDENSFALKEGWFKDARLDAIDWILNNCLVYGFQFTTSYLSMVLFDRFLSKRSIGGRKLWTVRLLSVACFSIAAKIEEMKVPPLSRLSADEFHFDSIVIQRMELLILTTLEWKVLLVTPHSYILYLVRRLCGGSRVKDMVSLANDFVKLIIREVNLLDYGPSVIAAAAVFAASDSQLTKETIKLKMSTVLPSRPLNNEHIFSVYNIMRAFGVGVTKTPAPLIFSDTSLIRSSAMLPSSSSGTKRRLTYDDSDRENQAKKKSQP